MDRASYLDSLRADATILFATADAGPLGTDVPSCPGWTIERLVGHIGRVYRRVMGWMADGNAAREIPRPPEGDAVVGWAREGLAQLLATFEATAADAEDPDARVQTWAGAQPPIFWPRRMAIETALHRWDAQAARGVARPLGTDLALDAMDELLGVIAPGRALDALTAEVRGSATMHLHATDVEGGEAGEGEWLVIIGPEGLTVEHAHAKGDVAVRGAASDLVLLLYNRVRPDRFEIFGDAALLDHWRAAVKI